MIFFDSKIINMIIRNLLKENWEFYSKRKVDELSCM